MSFKRLNDKQRWISIEYFLENANNIVGTTFTFLVDRRISTISGTKIDEIVNIYSDCFNDGISNATAEKMFRGASFVALLLAGLKKEKQSTYWISDNDEILDTFDRREGFGKLVSYFTFGLTHWKAPADCHFTTTGNRMAPDWGEDFCAIPDLVAGTLSNFAHELPFRQGRSNWETILSRKVERDPRVRVIGDWMALQEGQLRHVVFTLEKGFGASAFYFAGATAKNPYRGSFLL